MQLVITPYMDGQNGYHVNLGYAYIAPWRSFVI